jgi:hypothetical protein
MSDLAECIECGKVSISPSGCWQPGEVCLFGMLFACSLKCAEVYAAREAAHGCRPGEPGFSVDVEPLPNP